MPKGAASAEVIQDSEDEQQPKKSSQKKSVSVEAEGGNGGAPQDEEESDEEYEIEKILDAKHGMFPSGRLGFLVKWKGYGEEHNSWVDERDAGNATDLINAYWETQKKLKKSKPKQSKSAGRPRKSETKGKEDSPVAEDTASGTNKRKKSVSGRKSKSSQPDGEPMVEDEEDERPAAKRPKQAPRAKAKGEDMDVDEEAEEQEYLPMKKYRDRKSWESLVQRVDTIERFEGHLNVFFTLTNGDKVVETSQECAKHFPQKLIQFYESNLRWRETE